MKFITYEMKFKQLQKIVKKRFGSMARFAKLIGVEYYELQKLYAASEKKMTPERGKRIQDLIELAKVTLNAEVDTDLSPKIKVAIKARIEELGGVAKFCEDYPEFNPFSVWQILNGTRKTVSASVKKLLETLKIEQ